MKRLTNTEGAGLFIDIGQGALKARRGDDVFEYPLDRGENGRLTDLCRERLTLSLRAFLGKPGRGAAQPAWCAVGARGVLLRRMNLPASAKEEFARVLRLQIESEFPLSPDELAWGWRAIGVPVAPAGGGQARQELLVAAVKKETLEDYASLFAACGVAPIFTPAALARLALYPMPPGPGAVLHFGRTQTEWVSFDAAGPVSLRILPWGGENITRSIQEKLGVTHDEAEKIKIAADGTQASLEKFGGPLPTATEAAVASLAEQLRPAACKIIYLTGKSARDLRFAPLLARLLGNGVACESLESSAGGVHSTTMVALQKVAAKNSAALPLILELTNGRGVAASGRSPAWKWAVAAALLAAAAAFFPYGESLLLKSRLEKKLAAVNADRGRLETIDQELDFLQDLKQEQPPYLDTLYLLARSAPPGTRLDALSLGRKGEISLRAKMGNAQQVTDFRSKLIDSGWFASVVAEEQSPTPDRQVTVRMTAQLNPASARKPLVVEASPKKPNRAAPVSAAMEMNFAPPAAMQPDSRPAVGGPPPAADPALRGGGRRGGRGRAGLSPDGSIAPPPASDADDLPR